MVAEGPGYWMHETSGVLRPAIEAYLAGGGAMSPQHITVMRAYLRQWIMASVWDAYPAAGLADRAALGALREAIDGLTSREAISRWLFDALDLGMDPL